jgi:hypothetical protein
MITWGFHGGAGRHWVMRHLDRALSARYGPTESSAYAPRAGAGWHFQSESEKTARGFLSNFLACSRGTSLYDLAAVGILSADTVGTRDARIGSVLTTGGANT